MRLPAVVCGRQDVVRLPAVACGRAGEKLLKTRQKGIGAKGPVQRDQCKGIGAKGPVQRNQCKGTSAKESVLGIFYLGKVLVLFEQDAQIGEFRGDGGRISSGGNQGPQPVDQFRGAGLLGQVGNPADVVESQNNEASYEVDD